MTGMTTALNGKSAVLRKPNAAPVLRTCVRSRNPGTTATLVCSGSICRISAFVTWSAATTTSGSQISSRRRGGRGPIAPVADTSSMNRLRQGILAALAQTRPDRIAGHGWDIPPAALALHAAGSFDGDSGLSRFARSPGPCIFPLQRDVRHDEQHRKLQLVLLQELEVLRRGRQDDPGLQRAADLLVLAERLDPGEHSLAQLDERAPPVEA